MEMILASDVVPGQRVLFKGEYRTVLAAHMSRHDGPVLTVDCPWREGMPGNARYTQWWPHITLGTDARIEIV